ncbi:Hypothetical protein HPV225_1328 [Helicobacter pylori v225d]|nr:Hypothetical protein HPV225_1328 [Helicobacter pylori v225d]
MKFDGLLAKILVLVGNYCFDSIFLKEVLKSFGLVLLSVNCKN